jgi:hypothetical protein
VIHPVRFRASDGVVGSGAVPDLAPGPAKLGSGCETVGLPGGAVRQPDHGPDNAGSGTAGLPGRGPGVR